MGREECRRDVGISEKVAGDLSLTDKKYWQLVGWMSQVHTSSNSLCATAICHDD
jgi:hypothetical protein